MLSIIIGVMLASTITDVGLAALMVLVGVAAIMVARTAKELKATLPGIKFEVGQINRAVNHVKPGEPPLIAQVGEIREWKDRQENLLRDHMKTTKELTEKVSDRMEVVEDHLKRLTAVTSEHPVVPTHDPIAESEDDDEGKLPLDLE